MSSIEMDEKPHSPHSHTHSDPPPLTPLDAQPSSPSRLKVISTVTFHITIALSVTMLNKYALNELSLSNVLLAIQMGVCVMISWAIKWFALGEVGDLHLGWTEMRALWGFLGMRVLAVGMKTWCLNAVQASFYQISRGLLLPFTVLLSRYYLKTRINSPILLNIAIVCFGFLLGVLTNKSTSSSFTTSSDILSTILAAALDFGVFMGVASSFTTAVESIVVKAYGKIPIFRAVYITSVCGFVTFSAISILSGEIFSFHATIRSAETKSLFALLSSLVFSGVTYYLVSIAAILQITVTSPTTHMISSAARGVLQTLIAVMIFKGEHMTGGKAGSIFFILAGSTGYTWVKEQERRRKEATTDKGYEKLSTSAV